MKPNIKDSLCRLGLSLLFAVAVTVFWATSYVGALNYQEQFQLFLTDANYFVERMAVPGGLADYVGEFLVQFYYQPVLGALIIAALYVAIQRLTWRLMRQMGAEKNAVVYLLSFLPSILLWWHMGDVNVMMTLPVAVLCSLLAAWGMGRIEERGERREKRRKWREKRKCRRLRYSYGMERG